MNSPNKKAKTRAIAMSSMEMLAMFSRKLDLKIS